MCNTSGQYYNYIHGSWKYIYIFTILYNYYSGQYYYYIISAYWIKQNQTY